METILSYLDNMFAHMPKTAEVNRAKKELSQMMETSTTNCAPKVKPKTKPLARSS